ncbi:glutamate 5-kinase [Capillimicrobium parvum]|uniref:Glutamate 5-kinase n=1 Tax=Capillimicrobium parvum TaxID=2884022 RepID=A0A9E6Y0I1_9ACTN|nr:glutamate 5-kinase [Capillimicrobium parvum]UGS37533.1 Glutamate 5-kinase [Capillimicrobium parvum]
MSRFVIKLGSAIVTRDEVMTAVCDEIAGRRAAGDQVVLVSSGAVARGLEALGRPVRPTTIQEMQAASAVGQGSLFRRWDELLAERTVQAAQVLLTSFDLAARQHYLNARQTLETLLEWGVVPVVNENDTTATEELSFSDNDFLAAQVAILVGADLLAVLTDTEGVYTADPRTNTQARLVPEIAGPADLAALDIGHNTGPLGTGGMRSKVVAAEIATAGGIETVICSGRRPEALHRALDGDVEGTRFHAGGARYNSFKLWLKYAKPSAGTVRVDAGAARALCDSGTSLLPVGIVAVEGAFDAGDAVDITRDGERIGKGIVNYTAAELRRVAGLRSSAVREVLPRASEEAVHRDYFVLT